MRATFILSLFREDIVRALFWTLVHSLWQGMALAILTGLVILFTRRSAPALRYNVLLGLFCLSLAAAGVTFFVQLRGTGIVSDGPAVVPAGVAPSLPVEMPAMSNLYADVERPWTGRLVSYLDQRADVLVAIWMVILFIRLVKLLVDLGAVQRLRYYRTRAVDESWRQRVEELARRMGIKRAVELLESSLVRVPMMAGVFKPVILVPLGLLAQLPPQQVEAVLLHELAHIRRKDYFVNLLQSIAETLFFFNPAILWISSLIRVERENCCDDIAVEESRSKKEFIHALVSFQEYQQSSSYTLAFAGGKNHLLDRVKRIIHSDNKSLNIREKLFLLISVFITAGLTMAYTGQEPTPVKQAAAQVKATEVNGIEKMEGSGRPLRMDADTSKPVKPVQSDNVTEPGKRDKAADTTVTPEQRRQWERAFAEQQRRLDEAEERLAEQEKKLMAEQERLNDLYAEALARVQDLRNSIHGDKNPQAHLEEEQARMEKMNELRLETQHNLESLQLRQNERQLKENRVRAEKLARQQEIELRNKQRELENMARQQEVSLRKSRLQLSSPQLMRDHVLDLQKNSSDRMNKHVAPVIDMLLDRKLITRTDDLSFSLDKDGLTVNGKKQPEEVFGDFKKAFLEDPQDYIRYMKKDGSESTSINRHKD